ncbi:MAG: DUF1016 family protein [Actinobacteria bacterium]|nr:DUF1016 family protein [Actinomycetota bacterium]
MAIDVGEQEGTATETATAVDGVRSGTGRRPPAAGRLRAQRAVNTELIGLSWRIGHSILTKQEAEKWGAAVIDHNSTKPFPHRPRDDPHQHPRRHRDETSSTREGHQRHQRRPAATADMA